MNQQPPQPGQPSPDGKQFINPPDSSQLPLYDHPTLPNPLFLTPNLPNPQPRQQRGLGGRKSWYQSRRSKVGIGCGGLIFALLLCLVIESIRSGGLLLPSHSGGVLITPHAQTVSPSSKTPTLTAGNSPTPPIASVSPHVSGNQIIDGSGHILILHGTHIQSQFNIGLWSSSSASRITKVLNPTIFSAIRSWNMNALRIPVSAYLYQQTNYMNVLDNVVQQANQAGLYVILANFEDAQSGGGNSVLDQQGLVFWKYCATHYKNNPMVMFDLINEPHYPDWGTWLNGNGSSLGLQIVTNAIRTAGAHQIIIAESNEDGSDGFSSIGSDLINDPNIVYSRHTYLSDLYNGLERSTQGWDRLFGSFATVHPIYIGEWAFLPNARYPVFCQNITPDQAIQLVDTFMNYMEQKGISWTAWSFTPSHLIIDTTSFTPTSLYSTWCCGQGPVCPAGMGEVVKSYLHSLH